MKLWERGFGESRREWSEPKKSGCCGNGDIAYKNKNERLPTNAKVDHFNIRKRLLCNIDRQFCTVEFSEGYAQKEFKSEICFTGKNVLLAVITD